jgi:phospholipid transport system substrate-binding protein
MDRLYLARNFVSYLLALSLLYGSNAIAGAPTDAVKLTVDEVIKILTDSRYQGDANQEERRRVLREAILPRFDFDEMAMRALGAEWDRLNAEERSEFVKIFTEFLAETAVQNIESYDDERFIFRGEKVDDSLAIVNGKILTKEKDEIEITYLLHRPDDEWKAYDFVVDGMSFIGNYRAQFHRLIRQSSFTGLVQRIKEKLANRKS